MDACHQRESTLSQRRRYSRARRKRPVAADDSRRIDGRRSPQYRSISPRLLAVNRRWALRARLAGALRALSTTAVGFPFAREAASAFRDRPSERDPRDLENRASARRGDRREAESSSCCMGQLAAGTSLPTRPERCFCLPRPGGRLVRYCRRRRPAPGKAVARPLRRILVPAITDVGRFSRGAGYRFAREAGLRADAQFASAADELQSCHHAPMSLPLWPGEAGTARGHLG